MASCNSYVLVVAAILASPAISFSAFAQDGTPRAALCGPRVTGQINVVVGSFPQSGAAAENSTKNLKAVFSGVIVGSLGSAGNIAAVIWDSDDRQYPDLRLQMEALLSQGGSGQSPQAQRAMTDIAEFLKTQNCDYLVGGQIVRDSKLLIATPFILNVAESSFASNLSPVVQEAAAPANSAAELFAIKFVRYIQSKRPSSPSNRQQVAIGCFMEQGADRERVAANSNQRFVLSDTVDAIQGALFAELSSDGRLAGRLSKPSTALCPLSGPKDWAPETIAVFGGVVESTGGQFTLRLSARAIERGSSAGFEISLTPNNDDGFAVQTKPISQAKPAVDFAAVRDFVGKVRRIVSVGMTADGVIFPGRDTDLPSGPEALSSMLTSLLESGKNEEALTLGFKALSRGRDNPIALLVIARAFFNKSDAVAGSQYLSSALAMRNKVADAALGPFLESAANAYKSSGLTELAINTFAQARDIFRGQGRDDDSGRLVRSIALLLFKSGKPEEARRTLLPQAEGKNDTEAIFALAQIDLSTGNINSAVEWLIRGSTLDPNDTRFKSQLASANRLLARNALAAKDREKDQEAVSYLEQALKYDDDTETIYLLGIVSYRQGQYERAIAYYERLLSRPGYKEYYRWSEAAWLNVLECYLLTERWDAVLSRAPIAIESALVGKSDSQLVALYLQSIAVALKDPRQPADAFFASEPYKKYSELRKFVSSKRLSWNNASILSFLDKQEGNPDTLQAVRALARDFSAKTDPTNQ